MSALHLGLDLGTTSLAGRLWTADGQVVAQDSCDNPQQASGADVITRLQVAQRDGGAQLQRQLVAGIEQLVGQLLAQAGGAAGEICTAQAAANPAISHLLAGQPVAPLLAPPYRPVFRAGAFLDSPQLGVARLAVPLYLLPLVSGYVGGDLLAVLFGAPPEGGTTLYLDLGTNAELALWTGGEWLVTSVAAGPAFEAGNLGCGMRYAPGAVTEVKIVKDRFGLTVAGGGMPQGLCGSGLFSLLSSALSAGLVAADGRIRAADEVATPLSRYLVAADEVPAVQLYRDARTCLRLSQEDVRAFQLAKGAVRAGVDCLLRRAGLAAEQVRCVQIAGALGGALPPVALKGVAMLPEIMLDKCRFLPDGVLSGLQTMQMERLGRRRVEDLAARLKAYPLSGTPAFEKAFLESLDFS